MTKENLVKELELDFIFSKFMDSLMARQFDQDAVFMELLKTAIVIHIRASREKYPEITDQTIVKLFADYAAEGCKCILRDLRTGG